MAADRNDAGQVLRHQGEPTDELIASAIRALVAGLNARRPERRWRVDSLPHRFRGTRQDPNEGETNL